MACPDASAAIHECVLAIKAHVTVDVLAETIHAFPSTSRILNGLFAEATLEAGPAEPPSARRRPRRRPAPGADGRATAPHRPRPAPVTRRRREHDEVGAAAGRQPSAVRLARADRRVDARGPDRAPQRDARAAGPRGGVPAGHDGAARVTAHAIPGHGSGGSTGASVPNGMTAPPASSAPIGNARGVRAIAPQPASLVDVGAQVDRLHRGGDPERREPADVGRIDELRVLHARHQGRRPDGRGERVEGRAHRGVADPVDLRRDPQRRGPRRRLAQPPAASDPDAVTVVGRPLARRGLHRLEEGGRPRSERPVGERLEPARGGAGRAGPGRAARRCGGRLPRRLELLGADAGVDPQPEVAGRGERPVGVERAAEATATDRLPGSWTATTPSASSSRVTARSASVIADASGDGTRDAHQAGRRLVEHAGRPAGGVAADHAAVGVPCRRRCRPPRARGADQQRVVVVGPERDPPARAPRARDRRRSASGRARRGPTRRPRSSRRRPARRPARDRGGRRSTRSPRARPASARARRRRGAGAHP